MTMNFAKSVTEITPILGYIIFLFIAKLFLTWSFLVDIITFSIYVLGFDILAGYMGWISFGHVLWLGTGSYAFALFIRHINPNPLLALLSSLAIAASIGFIASFVALRKGGAYFALINLAFACLGFFLVTVPFKDITGGYEGIWVRMEPLPLLNLLDRDVYYGFLVLVFAVILFMYKRFAGSSFSYLLRAIKEDETRVEFLGYNTFRIKQIAYILSVTLSTLAGSLYSGAYGYASAVLMNPLRSAEVIVAALIGGSGTFYGALLGAFLFVALKDLASAMIVYWELFLGLTFVLLMSTIRGGVYSLIRKAIGGERA